MAFELRGKERWRVVSVGLQGKKAVVEEARGREALDCCTRQGTGVDKVAALERQSPYECSPTYIHLRGAALGTETKSEHNDHEDRSQIEAQTTRTI